MATRVRVIEAYSPEGADEQEAFGIDIGFNSTLRVVELGYSSDEYELILPYVGIDSLIEALKRIQLEYAE